MNTHIGKIGRLDSNIRHELGVRLEDGEPNKSLVEWLNSLPRVQERLKLWFEGRAITEQNLSEWKQHGHQAWLRLQATRQLAQQLTEDAEALEAGTEGDLLSDKLAVMVAAELGRLMTRLLADEKLEVEAKWKRLKAIHRELSQLRRDDHRAAKLRAERKEREEEEVAAMEAATKQRVDYSKRRLLDKLWSPLQNKTLGRALRVRGYGDKGEKMAEVVHRIQTDQPWGKLAEEITEKAAALTNQGGIPVKNGQVNN